MADIRGKAGDGVRKMGWGYLRRNGLKLFIVYVLAVTLCWIASQLFQINGLIAAIVGLTGILTFIFLFLLFRSKEINEQIDNAVRGARAEDSVEMVLTMLPNDYFVIHDVSFPGWNIDHIVIGPTGLFVLETKSYNGVVRRNNKYALKNAKQAKRNAVSLQQKLHYEQRNDQFVTPVLVYPDAQLTTNFIDGVKTLTKNSLIENLTKGNMLLDQEQVNRLIKSINDLIHTLKK